VPISIAEACVSILDGPCTYMWTFGGTYPGLTMRRPTGQTTRVTFFNNLPTLAGGKTVHHHGSHTASTDDGQVTGANFLFEPGQARTYTYNGTENGENERGAMQWYHEHRMGETGMTVWMGLAGLFIVDDPADPATLPSGQYELPLVIADRQFDENNQIQYFYDPSGVVGDTVLVNGVYQPFLDVADRKYRLRILNGANARSYIFTLSTGDAFTQIGTESGLLPAPVSRTAMDVGPGERLDAVVDFAGKLGQELYLMDAYQVVPLLKFRVNHSAIDTSTVPSTLRALPEIGEPTVTRNFSFDFTSNHWSINGLTFDPDRIDARPVLGSTEKWVFTNPTGTTHMVHIHDVDQQCISRDGGPCYPYEKMKETWSVGPGETLELKMKFTDHVGKYVLHCHILEHEDDGMMTQFEVVGPTPTPAPSTTPGATPPPPASQTINLSTRMQVQTGDNVGIGGFIVTGTAPKHVLLRAIGPSITSVPGVLADPVLELHRPGGLPTITNDNWRDDPAQETAIIATGIAPKDNLEPAIDVTLNPGAYTAVVRGKNNTSGIALIEVYDLSPAVPAKLANISTRAFVGTGNDIVIAGFILGNNNGNARIVVRGIGPSLNAFGVANALANPALELRDNNGALLMGNNDWQDNAGYAAEMIAAGLAPTNSLESGIAATLPPGPYTALLVGSNNGTGVGVIEVYDRGAP
jgi:FtsP/CotA-like multicopper oxidase with cupredoxin domain